jgi:hypothetical protein
MPSSKSPIAAGRCSGASTPAATAGWAFATCAADQRLASFDRDGDGRVAPEEIPRRFEWVLSQAPLSAPVRNRPVNQPLMQTEPVAKGPPWFQKMDRNRDGDLSPREFLGPRAEFRRLDANGDGLIDDREAKETHPHGDQTETLRP